MDNIYGMEYQDIAAQGGGGRPVVENMTTGQGIPMRGSLYPASLGGGAETPIEKLSKLAPKGGFSSVADLEKSVVQVTKEDYIRKGYDLSDPQIQSKFTQDIQKGVAMNAQKITGAKDHKAQWEFIDGQAINLPSLSSGNPIVHRFAPPKEPTYAKEKLGLDERRVTAEEERTKAATALTTARTDELAKKLPDDKRLEYDTHRDEIRGLIAEKIKASSDIMLSDSDRAAKQKAIDNAIAAKHAVIRSILAPPARGAAQAAPVGDEPIQVISPDGKKGTIPASQLEKAKAKGYKLANG